MSIAELLARSSWRFYRRHPAQLMLSMLGILLGVAIVTAVLITNQSSQRAFAWSTEALYGASTHQIEGADGVDQGLYRDLRGQFPHLPMAPIVEGHVAYQEHVFSVLGVDAFAEAAFGRMEDYGSTGEELNTDPLSSRAATLLTWLLDGDGLFISAITQARLQLPLGDAIKIQTSTGEQSIRLLDTFNTRNAAASDGLLIGDIATVQALLSRGDRLDRIELILDDSALANVTAALPVNVQMRPSASRHATMQAMTRGFQINLTAMSLLALLVGAFLIHNTMTFAVLQRRELFAVKRITGITSRDLLLSLLIEAGVISLVASVLGVALGYALAHALIQLTTQTINDLYFVLHVQTVWFSPGMMLAGVLLGVGTSVLAASLSALDAASTSPIQARQRSFAEHRTQRALPWFAAAGVVLGALGLALAVIPSRSLVLGFGALMLLIVGYGLLIPWAVLWLTRLAQPLLTRINIASGLACGGIARNISRTGLATAALTIAVASTFGVDVMIGSFRHTVDTWLGNTLQSDVYLSAPSAVSSRADGTLNPHMITAIRSLPGVTSISTGRSRTIATDVGSIDTLILEPHPDGAEAYDYVLGSAADSWSDFLTTNAVMISEPLATRHELRLGDPVSLLTERAGYQPFRIVGVFRDYGSSHGLILMARAVFARHFQDQSIATVGLKLAPGADEEPTLTALRELVEPFGQALQIRSNRAIHRESLAVFDRTFEITRVLRWLTVGVAFVGIFSALLALHLERAREFAVLRATGTTRWQLVSLVTWQTFFMGLLAGLFALPLGWIMSQLLIHVINVRSFGWSMQALLPDNTILTTLTLATSAALLAGLYPAWRLGHTNIARQLRDE